MEQPGFYLLWHLRRWQKSAFNCSFSDLFNSSQQVWSLLHMVPWSFPVSAPGSLIWDRKPQWTTEPPFIQTRHQSLKFVLTLVRDKRDSNTPQCRMQGSIQTKVQPCRSMGQEALEPNLTHRAMAASYTAAWNCYLGYLDFGSPSLSPSIF